MTDHIPSLPQKDYPSGDETRVIGQVMQAFISNIRAEAIRPVLARHDIDAIDPEAWYPQALFAEIYDELEGTANGMENIVAVGVSTVDALDFPPDVTTIPQALAALPAMYEAIHHNLPPGQGWQIEAVGPQHYRVTFNSPYSDYAAYGYLFAIARRFRPKETTFSVRPDSVATGAPAVFNIRWE